jgi:UDP-2,3-diacylglucosamine hydrolase
MTLLKDPSYIEIADKQYILSHGDALCTADVGYQVFRTWVRKPWLQKLFLRLPVAWRLAIAKHLRSNSLVVSRIPTTAYRIKTNVTLQACAALMQEHSQSRLIHGHTHLTNHHREQLKEQTWQRWVLSDWDLDHPESFLPKANTLYIDGLGPRFIDLIKPEQLNSI